MIIWLASYPRSGNTLTRSILDTVFDVPVPSIYPEDRSKLEYQWGPLVPAPERLRSSDQSEEAFIQSARESDRLHVIKTHRLPPATREPAIVLSRDARAAIYSLDQYFRGFDHGARTIPEIIVGERGMPNWSQLNRGWLRRDAPTLHLRFDALTRDVEATIAKIADFIEIAPKHDYPYTFADMHAINPKFFRSGDDRAGIAEVEATAPGLFWAVHGPMMAELGYVDARPKGAGRLSDRAAGELRDAFEQVRRGAL